MSDHNRAYGAQNIQVLEGLEPVRKRPGMYIGSTDERGLHHLVYEVVDNSVDEALAGRCDTIRITIHENGAATIEDNGSGIPVETHPTTGKSTLETVLTVLHAGGKFDNEAYQYSGGLHGVGVSVVNALSQRLVATIQREGKVYRQTFSRGRAISQLEVIAESAETGTAIYFEPDDEIFETTDFNAHTLSTRFQEMGYLNRGVRFIFIDERSKETTEYHYEGGISEFVKHINEKKTPITETVQHFTGEQEGILIDIAFQYTKSYSEDVQSYANTIRTPEGGTHLIGFRSALTRSVNDYARKSGLLKEKDDNLSGDDVREGITAIVTVKLNDPQFEGQTKSKLGNSEVRGAVDAFFSTKLSEFFIENPKEARIIVEKGLSAYRAREAARKARDLTRSKNTLLESTTLPGKLTDCISSDISENEVFLVEGDSAGGSAKSGRDSRFQAVLPLRGKILNVEKASINQILSYEEIKSMITAFGTGIGPDFNLDKLRYGKIIIMTDADVDGAHIRTLLLTFFFRYLKPLVEEGHIYIAQPPLYKVTAGKMERYCYDDKELEKVLATIDGKYKISRYKGLGEMNADQLWETTMDPDHRVLLQVQMGDDHESLDETFKVLMGSEVEPRRNFIEENARYAEHIDA